ncbi:unnamed protein product [Meganyctiphanes norvegica]|uniref:Uncharacterized protein n=1 Tax=Meganyctiphanes norvegica TaxID=48144 RepID=A0AAV2S670_MEGNR
MMQFLALSLCLVLVAAAPPLASVDGNAVEASATTTIPTVEYLDNDEVEYEAPLAMVPVLLLTAGELDGIMGDMEYNYGEDLVLEEQGSQEGDVYQLWEDYDNQQEQDEEQGIEALSRSKRQVSQQALDLAFNHRDRNGNPRPVGRIHGRFDLNGVRNDRNNHHTQAGVGLGSVVYRSNNGRHSVGVGAYGTQGRGWYFGYGYKTQPQWGAGVGYRFRF